MMAVDLASRGFVDTGRRRIWWSCTVKELSWIFFRVKIEITSVIKAWIDGGLNQGKPLLQVWETPDWIYFESRTKNICWCIKCRQRKKTWGPRVLTQGCFQLEWDRLRFERKTEFILRGKNLTILDNWKKLTEMSSRKAWWSLDFELGWSSHDE